MGSPGDAVAPPILVSPKKPPPLPEAAPPSEAEASVPPAAEPGEATAQASGATPASPAVSLTAKGLVDLIEGGNLLAVSLAAQSAGVSQGHPGLDPLLTFTPNTRKTLEGLAPAALPYVESWLRDHALIGCIVFGGACAWSIAQNMGAAKKLAPPAKKAAKGEPAPAAAAPSAPSAAADASAGSIPSTEIPPTFR